MKCFECVTVKHHNHKKHSKNSTQNVSPNFPSTSQPLLENGEDEAMPELRVRKPASENRRKLPSVIGLPGRPDRQDSLAPWSMSARNDNRSILIEDKEIITPFALVLASLRKACSTIQQVISSLEESGESQHTTCLKDASGEIEWSLSQLVKVISKQSFGNLAKTKFKKLLSREMSLSKHDSEVENNINNYIYQTFVEHDSCDSLDTDVDEEDGACDKEKLSETPDGGDVNLTRASLYPFGRSFSTLSARSGPQTNHQNSSSSPLPSPTPVVSNQSIAKRENNAEQRNVKFNWQITRFKRSAAFMYANRALPELAAMCKMTNSSQKYKRKHASQDGVFVDDAPDITPHLTDFPASKRESIQQFLDANMNEWGLNIFKLDEISNGHPLSTLAFHVLQNRGLLKNLHIPALPLYRYLKCIEQMYKTDNPYHNRIHGADVMQSSHVLLQVKALKDVFTDLEIFATIMAGAIHDVNHPGVTNQFIINSNGDLALLYNDISILENHHTSCAFTLLMNPEYSDIFVNFSQKEYNSYRKIVTDVVLATDMSKHMKLMADFRTLIETNLVSHGNLLVLEHYGDRIQVLQTLLHCADLSNPTKPFSVYSIWTEKIFEEFHRQGDLEKSCGLDISPMCDRENACLPKAQISFIDFVVHPLWETWCDLILPEGQLMLDNLKANYFLFKDMIDTSNTTNANPES